MKPSPAYMSIWDVAFHWHDIPAPHEDPPALPPVVRDTVTALLHQIVNSKIGLYEPVIGRCREHGRTDSSCVIMGEVENLPDELGEMFTSGVYERESLAYYRMRVDALFFWAVREGFHVPDFAVVPEYVLADSEELQATSRRARPEAEDRRLCQEIAKRRWADDEQIRIAEMAREPEIQVQGNGGLYEEATLRRWLREVAPPAVRGRAGRPVKKVCSEN